MKKSHFAHWQHWHEITCPRRASETVEREDVRWLRRTIRVFLHVWVIAPRKICPVKGIIGDYKKDAPPPADLKKKQ
jgi:hypothetical protein